MTLLCNCEARCSRHFIGDVLVQVNTHDPSYSAAASLNSSQKSDRSGGEEDQGAGDKALESPINRRKETKNAIRLITL